MSAPSVAAGPAQGQRSFRALWLGQGVSQFGTQISTVALPLAALTLADANAAGMGVIAAAGFAPAIVAPLYAGAVVDRVHSLRGLLVACDSLRFALTLLVPLAYWWDVLSVGVIAVVALANSLVWNVEMLGTSLTVRHLLPPQRYAYANGRLEGTRATAEVAGPSLGGVLAQLLGPAVAVLVDAFTFLFSASQMTRVSARRPHDESLAPQRYWTTVVNGFKVVGQLPVLRFTGIGSGLNNFFAAAIEAVLAFFVLNTLGFDKVSFGLVVAAAGLGGVIGGFGADRIMDRFGVRASMTAGIMTSAATTVVAALLPTGSGWWVEAALVAAQVVAGVGVVVFIVANASIRQASIPEEGYAQTLTSLKFLSSVGLAPGALLGGLLSSAFDVRVVLITAALGQVVVGVAFFLGRSRLPVRLGDEQ